MAASPKYGAVRTTANRPVVSSESLKSHFRLRWIAALLFCLSPFTLDARSMCVESGPPHFFTLPPHAMPPSGDQCSKLIASVPETRPDNVSFNHTVPSVAQLDAFHHRPVLGTAPPAADFLRVDGNFTGTTDMILRWAACKWGIDEDVVRAQAWTESKWKQGGAAPGDGGGDKKFTWDECVQGDFDALWNFACEQCCFQSWGILQTKVYYAPRTWPMIKDSTAFNADYRYAEERACMNGGFMNYFASRAKRPNTYAEDVEHGDVDRMLWGCTGMHYSGSWYDPAALRYISETKRNLVDKPWLLPDG
jgi:hypothetical protein